MRTSNTREKLMAQSGRGRGRGWGIFVRRQPEPYAFIGQPRRPLINLQTPRDPEEPSDDDSTEPPSDVGSPCPIAMPGPKTHRDDIEPTTMPVTETVKQKKPGQGPAKCTEFDKLRKHDMSYGRWTDVPKVDKDELIERVRGDFELDWDLYNHRIAITKALCKRFSAVRCGLHKKYLSYGSHEEALASGSILVDPIVWAKLCDRWGSDSFKKISNQNRENRLKRNINHTAGRKSFRPQGVNMVEFYKDVRWLKKRNKFVTPETEELHVSLLIFLST